MVPAFTLGDSTRKHKRLENTDFDTTAFKRDYCPSLSDTQGPNSIYKLDRFLSDCGPKIISVSIAFALLARPLRGPQLPRPLHAMLTGAKTRFSCAIRTRSIRFTLLMTVLAIGGSTFLSTAPQSRSVIPTRTAPAKLNTNKSHSKTRHSSIIM